MSNTEEPTTPIINRYHAGQHLDCITCGHVRTIEAQEQRIQGLQGELDVALAYMRQETRWKEEAEQKAHALATALEPFTYKNYDGRESSIPCSHWPEERFRTATEALAAWRRTG